MGFLVSITSTERLRQGRPGTCSALTEREALRIRYGLGPASARPLPNLPVLRGVSNDPIPLQLGAGASGRVRGRSVRHWWFSCRSGGFQPPAFERKFQGGWTTPRGTHEPPGQRGVNYSPGSLLSTSSLFSAGLLHMAIRRLQRPTCLRRDNFTDALHIIFERRAAD